VADAWVGLDEGRTDAGFLEWCQGAGRDSLLAKVVTALRVLELERQVQPQLAG
jgi:hypothetical protein